MSFSVTDPISLALDRTITILFRPFRFGKWFVLGFCAFLAHLGEGGGGSGFNMPTGGGGAGGPLQNVLDWIKANMLLFVAIVGTSLALLLALTALLTWIRSRGKFMFLDGIVQNRGAVVEPWQMFRALGNRLFGVTFLLSASGIVATAVIALTSLVIAWPDLMANDFGSRAIAASITCALALLIVFAALIVAGLLLENMVVPTMYLRRAGVLESWRIARRDILAGRAGTIVLFFLMKLAIAVVSIGIGIGVAMVTCCIAALPYIGTVILLPVIVFNRCYTLCFIEQLGEPWRFFRDGERPLRCPWCGYDLQGIPHAVVCPECGVEFAAGTCP